MKDEDKISINTEGLGAVKFAPPPPPKYTVHFPKMNYYIYFEDMTFMQRWFARWFLSGKIINNEETQK